jgi:hypothetical protein
MTDQSGRFNGFDFQEAIDLRRTTRNTRAKRWFVLSQYNLAKLNSMNLIETHEDKLAFTNAELDVFP